MRQSVPVRPALLSLALGTSFALSPPATASQGPHAQPPAASARRLPAPDLLALPRIDIPLPEHRPGDDTVQLAAGEVLSLELPIAITALFEPGWEDLDETQHGIPATLAPLSLSGGGVLAVGGMVLTYLGRRRHGSALRRKRRLSQADTNTSS